LITKVHLRNFRGVVGDLSLALGRITLLSGRNGLGKTTLFDAIDWCLFGSACRFGTDTPALQNLYAPGATEVIVDVTLQGRVLTVTRTQDGASLNGNAITDKDLALELVRDPDLFPPYARDHAARVRRFVYLTQTEMRELLSTRNREERASLFSSLAGVPNAALVTSSVRRVHDRIQERLRDSERSLVELRSALGSLPTGLSGLHGAAEEQPTWLEIEVAFSSLFVSSGAPSNNAETMLSEVESEAAAIETAEAQLKSLRLFAATIQKDIDAAGMASSVAEHKSRELTDQIGACRTAIDQDQVLAGALEADLAAALIEVTAARESLRTAATAAQRVDAAAALQARIERDTRTLTDARRSALECRQAVQTVTLERQALTASLDSGGERLGQARGSVARMESEQARMRERDTLVAQTAALRAKLDAAVTEERAITEAMLAEDQAFSAAAERLQSALDTLGSTDQLLVHVAECGRLARDLRVSDCPLCGAEYPEASDLLTRMRRTYASVKQRANAAEDERKRLKKIRENVDAKRSARQRVMSERLATERMLSDLEAALNSYRDLGDRALSLYAADVAAAQRHVGELQDELARQRTALRELEAAHVRLLNDLQRAENTYQAAGEALREAGKQLQAYEVSNPSPNDNLPAAQTRVSQAELRAKKASEELERARSHQQRRVKQIREYEALLASAEAERIAQAARIVELEAAVRARAATIPVLEEQLQAGRLKAAALQSLRDLLTKYLQGSQVRAAVERARTLRADEAAGTARLTEWRRADRRLADIAEGLRRRVEREGSASLARARGLIQECLDSLYPQRHLNQLDIADPEILLSDGDVAAPVAPEPYLSTGQLGVLALAVFFGVALTQRFTTLGALLLDEPVQNLDDLHFLALLALVRRAALSRQVVFSTADSNIAELFTRQMRSSHFDDGKYFVHYQWRDFDPRRGPTVVTHTASGAQAIA
jgi:DNA repair exonuclease SbcCD ATPase subunit